MTEIFNKVQHEINKSELNNTYGIIITGGGSQLNNLVELGQEIFQKNITIGYPRNINGNEEIINNPRFSTAIGLIKYGLETLKTEDDYGPTVTNIVKDLFTKLKKLYNKWY